MARTLVLKNGRRLTPRGLEDCDIVVADGVIAAVMVAGTAPDQGEVIDLAGAFVSPGLVDVHEHFREPGETAKETIATGTLAAAHGGFTTVVAMPNVTPVPDTPALFEEQLALNAQASRVKTLQYAPITQGRTGTELVAFDTLSALGAFAFTNDGNGVQDADTMYQAMRTAAALGKPIVAHAEDDSLVHGGVMREGAVAKALGLPGIPSVSETAQVARDLALAKVTGVHYHVCHVSLADTVAVIRAAKRDGVWVTAEVSPHHLLLTTDDISSDDALYKMNPPLGTPTDRDALLAGLADGTIDMIATDHAPHTDAEKAGSMRTAPFGIIGNETAFSTLYTKLVREEDVVSLADLVDWLAIKPARAFGMAQTGDLTVGSPADIAVFDLDASERIQAESFLSKGHNSPFIGTAVYGTTVLTVVAGSVAYRA